MFENNATVEYVISGANSLNSNSQANINTVPTGSLKFMWPLKPDYANGGFVLVQANKKSMTLNFIESRSKTFFGIPIGSYQTSIIYSKVILPRV